MCFFLGGAELSSSSTPSGEGMPDQVEDDGYAAGEGVPWNHNKFKNDVQEASSIWKLLWVVGGGPFSLNVWGKLGRLC